ncbi:OadG family protein [Psychrilyobacter atlanticus]|uniref:OadG family protein n=1 Tax=Psychrilyobacter atlanticus TaxID=271091 RepID=UPI0003FE24BC|nr:OadG family protein [Psychrilyobacter atlanticus]
MIFQAQMTFTQGLQLTAIAMIIVFTLLFIISLILGLFKYIPQEKKVPQKKKSTTAPVLAAGVNWNELESDEDMMIASLVASMEAAKGRKETNYKITRITKL